MGRTDRARVGSSDDECPLERAIGHSVECTRACCPFWEPGGAVVPAGCVFDRVPIDFNRRRDVTELVLTLKTRLERPSSVKDEQEARSRLSALLHDEFGDDE